MALRRSRVRIPLGPLKLNKETQDVQRSVTQTLDCWTLVFIKVDRSSKPSASEPGERGVSPTKCPRSTIQAELTCPEGSPDRFDPILSSSAGEQCHPCRKQCQPAAGSPVSAYQSGPAFCLASRVVPRSNPSSLIGRRNFYLNGRDKMSSPRGQQHWPPYQPQTIEPKWQSLWELGWALSCWRTRRPPQILLPGFFPIPFGGWAACWACAQLCAHGCDFASSNGCRVTTSCTRWAGIRSGNQLSNMPLPPVFSPASARTAIPKISSTSSRSLAPVMTGAGKSIRPA